MVSCNMIASEWNHAFVSLKSCQIKKKKDLPFLIFFSARHSSTWDPDSPGSKPRYPIYRYLRLQRRRSLSLHMSLQHPRPRLTSRTSWPSLLSSGWTQPRPELCDVFHRRLGQCWKSCSGRPSSWLHWAQRDLSIGYSNGRLDKKGIFILTSHSDFVQIKERAQALGQSVKCIYSIQSDIIAS